MQKPSPMAACAGRQRGLENMTLAKVSAELDAWIIARPDTLREIYDKVVNFQSTKP
jgi:hypothetical protein